MYFDTSHKKILTVGAVGVVLSIAVLLTFQVKNYFFGSTPFFPAAGIFINSALDNFTYSFASADRQMAGVFSAFVQKEEEERDALAVPVLTYHRIEGWGGSASGEQTSGAGEGANVTLGKFRDQMEELKRAGWQTVTLEEFEAFVRGEAPLLEKSFVITFDDGAKDSFYPVDPILRALGFNAVNYLIVSGVTREESTYYLSQEEIERMLDTGRWEIGSHTYDAHHPIPINAAGEVAPPLANKMWKDGRLETTQEFRTRISTEFSDSRAALADMFGVTVDTFAFPFGDTGETSRTFPTAEATVLEEAAKHYRYAFIQNDREHYTFNYPSDEFLLHRIHVAADWSGKELLRQMEGGLPKDLPYTDAIDTNNGWLSSWGALEVQNGEIILSAESPSTSASAILDGTKLWERYEVNATVSWNTGYALLLVSAPDARTYRSCAFENGRVRLQQTSGGTTFALGEVVDASIVNGSNKALGARVTSSSVTCLYDGKAVLSVTGLGARSGGIGFQAWHATPGTARMSVTDLTVTPL